jgi:hypothetical protein
MAIFLGVFPNLPQSFSAKSQKQIDLFTQKVPLNGVGANQSSDAFEPQELVTLYALVTYFEEPSPNELVSFQIIGPSNPYQIIMTGGTNFTNQNGIAEFSFRIPWPPDYGEQIAFGEWFAIATVAYTEQPVLDSLTFQVGWLIKITRLGALNAQSEPQQEFLKGDTMIFELIVKNIALTPKSATILIDAQDADNCPIIHTQLDGLVFPPGESSLQSSSQIPATAALGNANVSAAPYKAPPSSGGQLYSPATLTTLEIVAFPSPVKYHDVAVTDVKVSPSVVYVSVQIDIAVDVANVGDFSEMFNVTVYYGVYEIATATLSLDSHSTVTRSFAWDTTEANVGTYPVWVSADTVPEEANLANNIFTNGEVTLLAPLVHDVAVLNISATSNLAYVGDDVAISVFVVNQGGFFETFDVQVFYNATLIQSYAVVGLQPHANFTVSVVWNTQSVSPGVYLLSASVDELTGEADSSDNVFIDGFVQVKAKVQSPTSGWQVLDWFFWGLIIVISLILVLFLALLIIRRRNKNSNNFYVGWTAWYYGYDLEKRTNR